MKHMNKNYVAVRLAFVIAGLGVLSACTTTGAPGTEVTRFHMGKVIPAQAVNMRPAEQADVSSLEYKNYASIVENGLAGVGFTTVPGNDAGMIAEISIVKGLRAKPPRSSGFSIGVGAGSYGSSGGISGGASIPVGGSSGGEVYVMQLDVSLIDRASNSVVWEGTAIRESEAAPGSPLGTMEILTAALFDDFPGPSGKTVTVAAP